MAEQVNDQALAQLRQLLRSRLNELADDIAGYSCNDYAEYAHLCGRIYGLAEAERDLFELDQKLTGD